MSKPFDFTSDVPPRSWFRQIQEILQNGVTFDDNWDGSIIKAYVGTSETEVGHTLGRAPRFILPVLTYPYGTDSFTFTRAPETTKIWIKGTAAAQRAFLIW